ncbi:hypothetical protein [Bartonella sp. 1-1C]|uniref:hypothetical protein n=1 Tax=Bartonella sp. 1-1C TaxID=515256 RepID=UPI0001F4CAEB|nr:hypothetical protein [Bartonella sp. 1-1C]ATO56889.1 hypothetical protein B11Cv2_001020 [Bartonella sp. 1-1C]CBI80314.1 hypothetical protein B11C_40004 [Bartonella sp. 1-1C]
MMRHSALIKDIESFLTNNKMSPYTFGFKSIKNGRLVSRLRQGGRIWPETEMRIRTFMKYYPNNIRPSVTNQDLSRSTFCDDFSDCRDECKWNDMQRL